MQPWAVRLGMEHVSAMPDWKKAVPWESSTLLGQGRRQKPTGWEHFSLWFCLQAHSSCLPKFFQVWGLPRRILPRLSRATGSSDCPVCHHLHRWDTRLASVGKPPGPISLCAQPTAAVLYAVR